MKDIAPSPQLRTWFGHDPSKFEEFSQKYLDELEQNTAPVDKLYELEKQHKDITLLYAAHHPAINHARVLQQFLTARQR